MSTQIPQIKAVNFDDLTLFGESCDKRETGTAPVNKKSRVAKHASSADLSVEEVENCPVYLQHEWKIYYDEGSSNYEDYESSMVCIGCFDTVQEFWSYWNNLKIEQMPEYCNLRIFKSDVKPLWEDENNINGSKWAVYCKDKQRRTEIWSELVLALVGERLACSDSLNGVVFSSRARGLSTFLWNRVDLGEEVKPALATQMRTLLSLTDEDMATVDYSLHKSAIEEDSKKTAIVKKYSNNGSYVRKGHHTRSNSRSSLCSSNSAYSSNTNISHRSPTDRASHHRHNPQTPTDNTYLRAERTYVRRPRDQLCDNRPQRNHASGSAPSVSSVLQSPADSEVTFAYELDNDQFTVTSSVTTSSTYAKNTEIDITDTISTASTFSCADVSPAHILTETLTDYLNAVEPQSKKNLPEGNTTPSKKKKANKNKKKSSSNASNNPLGKQLAAAAGVTTAKSTQNVVQKLAIQGKGSFWKGLFSLLTLLLIVAGSVLFANAAQKRNFSFL